MNRSSLKHVMDNVKCFSVNAHDMELVMDAWLYPACNVQHYSTMKQSSPIDTLVVATGEEM